MPSDIVELSPFMTPHEAAIYLRLSPRTLDNMRQRGTGPIYTKHGGRIVYHRDDLVAWSQIHRQRTSTERETPLVKPVVPNGVDETHV